MTDTNGGLPPATSESSDDAASPTAIDEVPDAASRPAAPSQIRRVARVGVTTLLVGGVAVAATFLLVRLAGMDTHTPLAQLIAYTPYTAAATLLVAVFAAAFRRWRLTVAAAVVVALYVALLAPRMFADGPAPAAAAPPGGGTSVTVMSSNMLMGMGDADQLVALVRRERPDVLSVQELTAEAVARLDAAGLAELLPHRALRPLPGTRGTGLYARTPLTDDGELSGTYFIQVRARTVHKGVPLDLVAVHPLPPTPANTRWWRRDFTRLPRAERADGAVTVLAGDFNATLDHSLLRELMASGYTDAAAATGAGLLPTWSSIDRGGLPVTIDHVLVEGGGARAVRVHDLRGSDHHVVVANLVLPKSDY